MEAASLLPSLRESPVIRHEAVGGTRTRLLGELLCVLGLLEFDLWYIRSQGNDWLRLLTYLAIALIVVRFHSRDRQMTARVGKTWQAWAGCLGMTAALAVGISIAGWLTRESYESCWLFLTHKPGRMIALWALRKCAVVAGQQIALQWFLWPVCRQLCPSRWLGLALVAGLFGFIHLPSLGLVAATAFASLVWVALYERWGRLLPVMLSHLILAVLAHGLLPERLHYDLRVGSEAYEHLRMRRVAYRLDTREQLRVLTTEAYYQEHGGTPEGFVRGLYLDLLQREPASWESALWLKNLARTSRAEAAEAMITSTECQELRRRP